MIPKVSSSENSLDKLADQKPSKVPLGEESPLAYTFPIQTLFHFCFT